MLHAVEDEPCRCVRVMHVLSYPSMKAIRAFIAIKIPESVQAKLQGVQDKLKQADAHVSWVKPANIHLTLKFLGNIEEAQIPALTKSLQESVKTVSPFQLQIGYAGAFPNLRYPRVVWIGVTDDEQDSLRTLQEDLAARLAKLGFKQESGRFKPHLTLGRVRSQKNRSNLLRAVEAIVNIWVGEISVDAIYLIQSELKPSGAEYTDLATIPIV
ncbi:RNA 2',3'-cyclic phosphodiesterase [candidate division KSB3 bacterium]|uniref:RNA 2',3'-cyclic phosphodiesterase n=1 Tax=candidate division KSB3 bacterium TaxID=2044937 RepID=A0A9D5JTT2_9BACT|nr:RNA 2',3'-cyclic phosphodiesterase [candidate division KSB3 bacterium]MBD3324050.1 RNA 2',3'-cyclic phosphodiesterase [candidate division KSB3 bacterium]